MKTNKYTQRLLIALCCILWIALDGYSQSQDFISYRDKAELTDGFVFNVADPFFNDPVGVPADPNYVIVSKESLVSLKYGKQFNSNIAGTSWEYKVEYFLTFTGDGQSTSTLPMELVISFADAGGVDEALQVTDLLALTHNVETVELHIDDICARATPGQGAFDCDNAAANALVPDDIRLESKIKVDRIRSLDLSQIANIDADYDATNQITDLKWSYVPGALEYLVEWVFLDNMVSQLPSDIYENAVSVRVKDNCHKINITYPSGNASTAAAIHYRVRAIGRKISTDVGGDFSNILMGAPATTFHALGTAGNFDGFEAGKNWQVQRTFAEDGKQKDIVQYFDNGLKPRQTITNLNTQKQLLIAEGKYDFHGRPRLNILPAPLSEANSNNLFYKPGVNTVSAGVDYGRGNFDKATGADPLSTSSGTSRYYSDQNDIETIYRDYLPDAKGYPMTVMEYKRDNSGRVARQGGVGDFYQLDSQRETKYFYSTPKSTELHRLFGSNVGLAKHYKKNYVVDANGQVSVSYIDQNGNVVATALAGTNPDNVLPLDGVTPGTPVPLNLMDNNEIDESNQSSVTTATIMNLVPNTPYAFTYNLATGAIANMDIELPDGTIASHCFACDYLLRIEIFDPCDVRIFDSGEIEINGGASCMDNATLNVPLTVPDFIEIGEYKVFKYLTLIPKTRHEILDIISNNDPQFFTDIFDEVALQYGGADTSPCDYLLETGTVTGPEYDAAVIAAFENQCDILLGGIETQVSPGGFMFESADFIEEFFNLLEPPMPMDPLPQFLYGDCEALVFPDPATCDAICLREFLRDNWTPCLARVLAEQHEEYCHYEKCLEEQNAGSLTFDANLYLIETWTDASDPGGVAEGGVIDSDPYFANNNPGENYSGDIINYQNDISDYEGSNGMDYPSVTLEAYVDSQLDQADPDFDLRKWEAFRALYLGFKSSFRRDVTLDNPTCDYQEHDFALVPDPAIPASNTMDPDEFIMQNLASHCGDMCSGNAEYWLMQLKNEIDEWCGPIYSAGDLEDFRFEFYDYCNSTCLTGLNPLGQITMEYLTANPAAFPIINGWLNTECSAVDFDATIAVDPNNNSTTGNPFYDCVLVQGGGGTRESNSSTVDFCNDCDYLEGLIDVGEWIIIEDDMGNEIDRFWREGNWNITALANLVNVVSTNCGSGGSAPASDKGNGQIAAPDRNPIASSRAMTGFDDFPRNPLKIAYMLEGMVHGISACDEVEDLFINYPREGDVDINYFSDAEGFVYNFFGVPTQDGTNFTLVDQQTLLCQTLLPYASGADRLDRFNYDWGLGLEDLNDLDQLLVQLDLWEFPSSCMPGTAPTVAEICAVSMDFECPTQYWICSWDFDPMIPDPTVVHAECIADLNEETTAIHTLITEEIINNLVEQFIVEQGIQCMEGDLDEEFYYEGVIDEYQYTLYYYDQAGSLVQTIPPEAVVPLDTDPAAGFFDTDGVWLETNEPDHNDNLLTRYRYNARGQAYWQRSPDGGLAEFYYDDTGRLKLSQDAKQRADGLAANSSGDGYFSYSRYDEHDRIVEVGQIEDYLLSDGNHLEIDFPNGFLTDQETFTVYDEIEIGDTPGIPTERLRNRVAKTQNNLVTTFYGYDIHGNVRELEHQIAGLGDKRMSYDYDLVSGNVKEVAYQSGEQDQFFHRYEYDADNRLTYAHTSEDRYIWEIDSRNFYYAHGPMARGEIGDDIVQGQDYYYTLQGWIKGANTPGQDNWNFELGADGNFNEFNPNRNIARDEMSYALGYNDQDYFAIGSPNLGAAGTDLWGNLSIDILNKTFVNNGSSQMVSGLFNGNICAMVTDLEEFDDPIAMAYQFDALHRIKQGQDYNFNGSNWSSLGNYNSTYVYDGNGNLENLTRNGPTGIIDNLTYNYDLTSGLKNHNRLQSVTDATDDPLGVNTGSTPLGYDYDEIGNLSDDFDEGTEIDWTVYGKVQQVEYVNAQPGDLEKFIYGYSPDGNRLTKYKQIKDVPGQGYLQYYVRDASGNVISTYRQLQSSIKQEEVHIYGSRRLGNRKFENKWLVQNWNEPSLVYRSRGDRNYEMSNHLGNVLAVVNDHKLGTDNDPGFQGAEYYEANIVSASDYYPFGLQMIDRNLSSPNYRYGFNGKEKDQDEEFGDLTHYDYGFRIYNPGIGKFLSVDPLSVKYPWYTPFQFSGNNPITNIDLDGREDFYYLVDHFNKQGEPVFSTTENGEPYRVASTTHNEPFTDSEGKTQYEHGERHYLIYVVQYNTFWGLAKGEQVVGKRFDSVEEIYSAKESDMYFRNMLFAMGRGLQFGDDVVDKATFIRSLAKNGLKKTGAELLQLAKRPKRTDNLVKDLTEGGMYALKGDKLPLLDPTGKIHGGLPRLKNLKDYKLDDLKDFAKDLKTSIKNRTLKNAELGVDKANPGELLRGDRHGLRQGLEEDLLKAVNKILETNK